MAMIEGGCLCGAIHYESDATPINVRVCHCRICQKATGASFYARVAVPLDSLTIAGEPGWHHSSEGLRRGFCATCGTTLFSERASRNMIGLAMGSLDDPDRFVPGSHIWVSAKQAWLHLDDDRPCYAENPPA